MTGRFAAKFGGELDALGFATAQGSARLSQANVPEADFSQGEQRFVDLRHRPGKK
jgi:hypothetical protein